MSNLQSLAELVTIGIATKNRWDELKITFSKLVNIGLSGTPVLILDACPDHSCLFDIQSLHPNATIQRFEFSKGYILTKYHPRLKNYVELEMSKVLT